MESSKVLIISGMQIPTQERYTIRQDSNIYLRLRNETESRLTDDAKYINMGVYSALTT